MSFYIELKNFDHRGDQTFLVHSFNRASKIIKKATSFFGDDKWGPDPDTTVVVLQPSSFRAGGVNVEIAIGYEEFKKTLLAAKAANQIPSFKYKTKYVFGE